jgi:hypothetical protein
MSVGAIGSDRGTSTAVLEKQLKADKQTLSDDQTAKATQQKLAADQLKVQQDQQAIAQAAKNKSSSAESTTDATVAEDRSSEDTAGIDVVV